VRVHADVEALTELARRTKALLDDAGHGRAALLLDLTDLRGVWDDIHYRELHERLTATLDRLQTGLNSVPELCRYLERLRVALERYLGIGLRPTGTLTTAATRDDQRRAIALEILRDVSVDWSSEDFRSEFYGGTHHGYCGDDYLALARHLPAVRRLVEGGLSDTLAHGSDARRCYDSFYGSDPIRIVKQGRRLSVDDGRHRLFACLELGIEPIAVLIDL